MKTIVRICHGCISVLGFGFGFMSIMPNIMMSDCNSKQAILSANIGLFASGLFMVTGVGGVYASILSPLYIRHIYTLFGISSCVQILAFINLFYISNDEKN